MLALPHAKILHSFKCLCAVLYSHILVRKSWQLFAALLWLCSSQQGVHAGSGCWHRGWGCCKGCSCPGHQSMVWGFCFEGDSKTECLPVNSLFEFIHAGSVLLTWVFLCACDKWLITRLITQKNWFWQRRSQNTLCLFPHGHAQIPPRWKKIRLLSGFFQGKSKTSPWRWPYSTENKQFLVVAWSWWHRVSFYYQYKCIFSPCAVIPLLVQGKPANQHYPNSLGFPSHAPDSHFLHIHQLREKNIFFLGCRRDKITWGLHGAGECAWGIPDFCWAFVSALYSGCYRNSSPLEAQAAAAGVYPCSQIRFGHLQDQVG